MRPNFVLLSGLLVDVGPGKDGISLDPRWQWDRAMHLRICPLGRIDDLRRALIEHGVVVGLHADADNFLGGTGHNKTPTKLVLMRYGA